MAAGSRRPSPFRRILPYVSIVLGGLVLGILLVVLVILPPDVEPPAAVAATPPPPQEPLPVVAAPSSTTSEPETLDTTPLWTVDSMQTPPVLVPNVVDMDIIEARERLTALGFQVTVTRDTSSFHPPNTILRQSPAGGLQVPARSSVTITASDFPPRRMDHGPRDTSPNESPVSP